MSWRRVRGHEQWVERFDRIVRQGRLAHAYLFAGPPGVGKRLFAEELTKALLCEAPPGSRLEACDQCAACKLVAAGTHPDFFVVGRPEDALELPISVVRGLSQGFSLKSARGRGKVAILDDADDLNDEAANCFLKTLEEPPPRSVLLLIGSSADRQLPTIVSRCQIVRFSPLPESLVAELLRSKGVEDPALVERLVRVSGRSLGRALALADPTLWDFRRKLLRAVATPHFDSVALGREWVHFVEEAGKESALQRSRASLVLGFLIDFLQEALVLSLGGTPKLVEPDDQRDLQNLAGRAKPDQLLDLLERALEADRQIDRRVQLVLILEALVDALAQRLH